MAWEELPSASADPTRWLTGEDLDFILQSTSRRRTDFERIREIVHDKPDLLEILLDDDRLYHRLTADDEILLKVSARLLFHVLLRRVRRQIRAAAFTVEPRLEGQLPVFDAPAVAKLVERPQVLGYLADMLASFVRTETRTLVVRRGPSYQRRVFSDMDVDALVDVAERVDPSQRFALYRRVADVSLFLLGIFPEHVTSRSRSRFDDAGKVRLRRPPKGREDYERIGSEFYRRAAGEEAARRSGLSAVLSEIGDHFVLATKPLHVLSTQIVPARRLDWFWPPGRTASPRAGTSPA